MHPFKTKQKTCFRVVFVTKTLASASSQLKNRSLKNGLRQLYRNKQKKEHKIDELLIHKLATCSRAHLECKCFPTAQKLSNLPPK